MNNICVYTVICGGYDKVKEIENVDDRLDYICFTTKDYKGAIPKCWQHVVIENVDLSAKELNRYYKINVTKILDKYKYSLYIDGNIEMLSMPDYIYDLVDTDEDIALYEHSERKNIYDESRVCIDKGLDYYWRFENQIKKYNDEGFISTQLFEANVIFRRHSEHLEKAMDVWWKEYINGVKRDQISFCYAMSNKGIDIFNLGKSDVRFTNDFFRIHHHAYPLSHKIRTRVLKLINMSYAMIRGKKISGKVEIKA